MSRCSALIEVLCWNKGGQLNYFSYFFAVANVDRNLCLRHDDSLITLFYIQINLSKEDFTEHLLDSILSIRAAFLQNVRKIHP